MSRDNQIKACQFCKILKQAQRNSSKDLLYEDGEFFAFHDIDKGSARQHILVCTKQHIESALEIKDKQMLERMQKVGKVILDRVCQKQGYNKIYRFGFHLRPLISIDHVHLHCLILPFSNLLKQKRTYGKLLTSVEEIRKKLEVLTPKL